MAKLLIVRIGDSLLDMINKKVKKLGLISRSEYIRSLIVKDLNQIPAQAAVDVGSCENEAAKNRRLENF